MKDDLAILPPPAPNQTFHATKTRRVRTADKRKTRPKKGLTQFNVKVRPSVKERIEAAFDDVAALIEAAGKKFYLLSYCSPARAGTHTLTVEVETAGRTGSLETPFNADGFGPKCNPSKEPVFSVGRIRIR